MKIDVITYAEMEAVQLLRDASRIPVTTAPVDYHKEADKIILLAERIKAQRATAAIFKT